MHTTIFAKHQQDVINQREELITKIQQFFEVMELDTVDFEHMFSIYVSEEGKDGFYSKVPVTIKSLEYGDNLIGQDWDGDEYEMEISGVEDIFELAYILDVLEKGEYLV